MPCKLILISKLLCMWDYAKDSAQGDTITISNLETCIFLCWDLQQGYYHIDPYIGKTFGVLQPKPLVLRHTPKMLSHQLGDLHKLHKIPINCYVNTRHHSFMAVPIDKMIMVYCDLYVTMGNFSQPMWNGKFCIKDNFQENLVEASI